MCGITGLFNVRERGGTDTGLLTRITQAVAHRGPDGEGFHLEPGVGLGHRRLSIIDIATGGQPMYSDDRKVVTVFNGEIYNFRTVREELKGRGYVFHTRSDTEVLLRAWEEWAEECVQHLRGMFAFAMWDARRDLLFLARDRLGIKPLYYALMPDGELVFGSELKSLVLHPHFDRQLDPLAVEDYFAFGYVPEPRTIYKAAKKLPPGCTLTIRRGRPVPEPHQYWDVPFTEGSEKKESDVVAELHGELRDAVECHLESDVPLGAFLSGGVDSSALVATMAAILSDPVNTCSITFGDPAFDEAAFARSVAERYHANHFEQHVEADDFELIDRLVTVYDEPFADSSALPTYRLCELARRKVTVALSGDGGDENFAGYRRYRHHLFEERLRSFLPRSLRGPLFRALGRAYPSARRAPRMFRAKSTLEALSRDSVEGYLHCVAMMSDALRTRLYGEDFRRQLDGYNAVEVLRSHASAAVPSHPLSLILYLDLKTFLVGDILTKVDRASMAHSLEVRVPFLDHRFVEWAASLPPELKLRNGEGKYILKKAMEPRLPRELLYRPKMGFAIPIDRWFRGPLQVRLSEEVLGPGLIDSGMFDPAFLQELVKRHLAGYNDYGEILWGILMFAGFLRAGQSRAQAKSAESLVAPSFRSTPGGAGQGM